MKHPPYKRRMIVLLVMILTVGTLATSAVSFVLSRGSIRERLADHELPLTGDTVASEVQRQLSGPVSMSAQMAQNTFLRDWALAGEKDPDRVVAFLNEIRDRNGAVTSFFVSARTRNHYSPDGMVEVVDETDASDAWFFRVQKMVAPYEINVEPDRSNRDTMTVTVNHRMVDSEGSFIGVTGVEITLPSMRDLIRTYEEELDRRIYFVDADGEFVLTGAARQDASGALGSQPGMAAAARRILSADEPLALSYDRDGTGVLVNTRHIPELNWFLVVEQDEANATGPVRRMLLINLAIGVAVTSLVLVAALLTVNRYQRRLELAASVDDLTGLANRRRGEEYLVDAMAEAHRKSQKLSAVLVDVDHFKGINDEHGHPVGDQVIRRVGELVRASVRQADHVVRWGGDEYLVLLRGCPHNEAVRLARAMLGTIGTHHLLKDATLPPVTVSVGVTEHQEGEEREAFLGRIDRALYRAKANGRNCVHGLRPREGELSDADIADLQAFNAPLHDRSPVVEPPPVDRRSERSGARRLMRKQ